MVGKVCRSVCMVGGRCVGVCGSVWVVRDVGVCVWWGEGV